MGHANEMSAQHTRELEPVILYSFSQAMVILGRVTFKEERYGGHLIDV